MAKKLLQTAKPAVAPRHSHPLLPFREPVHLTEKLLHFIWGFGYYNKEGLATVEGESLTVLAAGTLNKNQGPDFGAARIRIGNTVMAGTVELHLKTSDWKKHRHDTDDHYRNVILHVVFDHDAPVNDVPVLELSSRVSTLLLERYASFLSRAEFIPCAGSIATIRELTWVSWKERLLVERFQRKAERVLTLFNQSSRHWEETFWWLLARAFGSKINGDSFEAVARSLPVALLAKHRHSLHQLEALLLGQAGLLNDAFEDAYPKLLQREYAFLQKKYNLQPVAVPVLFLRMRPGNFPTVRLAQLAFLLQQSSHLFSKILEAEKPDEIRALFFVTANDFWHYHYTFQEATAFKKKTVGGEMASAILINTVVPVLFAYGLYHKTDAQRDKALRWLAETAPETNSITNGFQRCGIAGRSAYDTQALLELKNSYCAEKRCLDCSVGNWILREAAQSYQS